MTDPEDEASIFNDCLSCGNEECLTTDGRCGNGRPAALCLWKIGTRFSAP